MNRKHRKILAAIFDRPISGNIKWADVVSLMRALNAEVLEREGSRVAFILNDHVTIQHRPHPSPVMDKGAIADLRDFLTLCGIKP